MHRTEGDAEDWDQEDNNIFMLTIAPNSVLSLQFTYQPVELGQHYFELPLFAAGIVFIDKFTPAI